MEMLARQTAVNQFHTANFNNAVTVLRAKSSSFGVDDDTAVGEFVFNQGFSFVK
jgi:hypothetical protein